MVYKIVTALHRNVKMGFFLKLDFIEPPQIVFTLTFVLSVAVVEVGGGGSVER